MEVLIKEFFRKLRRALARAAALPLSRGKSDFAGSHAYWNSRYEGGGTSGAGSYGQLAESKAAYINQFVAENSVSSVLEFGCGDGNQLRLYDFLNYTGVDVSEVAVAKCQEMFRDRRDYRFLLLGDMESGLSADLTMSIDVVYHLVEDEVFDSHLNYLFSRARRFVVVYSTNFESTHELHVRHREFLTIVRDRFPDFVLAAGPTNPFEGSSASFFVFKRK